MAESIWPSASSSFSPARGHKGREGRSIVQSMQEMFPVLDNDIVLSVVQACNYDVDQATETLLSICSEPSASSKVSHSEAQHVQWVKKKHSPFSRKPTQENVSANSHKKHIAPQMPDSGRERRHMNAMKNINIYISSGSKILIIMRGCPGSGKSYFARSLVKSIGGKFKNHIYSTDDFFVRNGQYNIRFDKLKEAHEWNQDRVSKAFSQGISPIIVDNTNVMEWEMQIYIFWAVRNGYFIEVIEPPTSWFNNPSILAKRTCHGVPKEKIKDMLQRYVHDVTVNDLIKKWGFEYSARNTPPQKAKFPVGHINGASIVTDNSSNVKKTKTRNQEHISVQDENFIEDPIHLSFVGNGSSANSPRRSAENITSVCDLPKPEENEKYFRVTPLNNEFKFEEKSETISIRNPLVECTSNKDDYKSGIYLNQNGMNGLVYADVIADENFNECCGKNSDQLSALPNKTTEGNQLKLDDIKNWATIFLSVINESKSKEMEDKQDLDLMNSAECSSSKVIQNNSIHEDTPVTTENVLKSWAVEEVSEEKFDKSTDVKPLERRLPKLNASKVEEKSPSLNEEKSFDWTKTSFNSWASFDETEINLKDDGATAPLPQRSPAGAKEIKIVSTRDFSTNTHHSDFIFVNSALNNASELDEDLKILCGRFRNINENNVNVENTLQFKLKLSKGTMTEDIADFIDISDKDESLQNLIQFFPQVTEDNLKELLDTCEGDINWASNCLLDNDCIGLESNLCVADTNLEVDTSSVPDAQDEQDISNAENQQECPPLAKENAEEEVEEESFLELVLDHNFVQQLDTSIGLGVTFQFPGITPVVKVPNSLAKQLYYYILRSYQERDDLESVTLQLQCQKDEEIARKLYEEMMLEPSSSCSKESVDIEMAQAIYRTNLDTLQFHPEDANAISVVLLQDMFPNFDEHCLRDVLFASNNSFEKTVDVLQQTMANNQYNFSAVAQKRIVNVKEPTDSEDASDKKTCNIEEALTTAEDYRKEAAELQKICKEYFQKAHEAFQRNQRSVAAYYSKLGNCYKRKIKEAHEQAAALCISAHAFKNSPTTLDLHYLRVREAVQALDNFLDQHITKLNFTHCGSRSLYIITGRGARSEDGRSRLKPAVEHRLRVRKLEYSEENPGLLKATITRESSLSRRSY